MDRFALHHGNSRQILRGMAEASVDSVVCDPPYELGFMGKGWDSTGIANDPKLWAEALRVAKPGAYLVAFGGTRTFHRMVCAIEDGGWEIRDAAVNGHMPGDCPWLMGWMYGSGFPKSHNGDWGGTALKPAWEPIVLARKPLIGTVEANWLEHGTGALNIDGCRVGYAGTEDAAAAAAAAAAEIRGRQTQRNVEGWGMGSQQIDRTAYLQGAAGAGRWPANLIHDGSPEVLACFPETSSGSMRAGTVRAAQDEPGSVCFGTFGGNATSRDTFGDAGSAARFFYCAKASQEDRDEGISGTKKIFGMSGAAAAAAARGEHYDNGDGGVNKTKLRHNIHPTVKPTDLMRWLVRLVTPDGGLVLDPFMGSGSTGKAAMLEGMRFIGIDLSAEYVEIARARIDFALRQGHQPELIGA